MRCQNLDERQLLLRGNVFQHTCILLFVLLLANGFLKANDIVWAQGMWENFLILWCGLFLCFCEFIYLDIYPGAVGQSVLYVIFGTTGVFLTGLQLFHLFRGEEIFIKDRMLTESGASLIQGSIMILVLVLYLCKRIYSKKRRTAEDDE